MTKPDDNDASRLVYDYQKMLEQGRGSWGTINASSPLGSQNPLPSSFPISVWKTRQRFVRWGWFLAGALLGGALVWGLS